MKTAFIAAMTGATVLASAAGADTVPPFKGNDTGGIIALSCESEALAPPVAGAHCISYGNYARITSVHGQAGVYIAFACLWTPFIARYQPPPVSARVVCATPPRTL